MQNVKGPTPSPMKSVYGPVWGSSKDSESCHCLAGGRQQVLPTLGMQAHGAAIPRSLAVVADPGWLWDTLLTTMGAGEGLWK